MMVIVALLTALFAIPRLATLGEADLSIDESFTALYADLRWSEIVPFLARNDVHPPGYFAFTKLFTGLGDSAWAYRLPAAIAGIAVMPVLYLAGTVLGRAGNPGPDRLTGLVALAIAGSSTALISYSQNARAYSLMVLGIAAILAGSAWIMSRPGAARTPIWSRAGLGSTLPAHLGIAAGFLLILWSHNVGVIYALACALMLVLLWLGALGASGIAFANLALTACVVILGWLPHVMTLLRQWGSVSSDYWIEAPTAAGIAAIFLHVLGDAHNARAMTWDEMIVAAGLFLAAAFGAFRMLRTRSVGQAVVVPGLLTIGALILLAVTYLARPVLLDRTALPLAAPFILLVAAGLTALPGSALSRAALSALVVAGAVGVFRQTVTPQGEEPWSQIVATIAGTEAAPSLVLTLPNSAAVPLAYHVDQQKAAAEILPLPGPFPTYSTTGRYPTGWPGVPGVTQESLDAADARIAAAPGDVWLLLRGYWAYDDEAIVRAHYDRTHCYQPLYVPGVDYFFLLRLIPKSAGRSDCTTYEPHRHYPYRKPDGGLVRLAEPKVK